MNKKGLIFIFLFAISVFGAVGFSNAASDDGRVDITLTYVPSAVVLSDRVYVEIDSRILEDNMIFNENDRVHFAFFYDVAQTMWGYGGPATGEGTPATAWYYDDLNNASLGYTGSDLYNYTRFGGQLNVMLDDYNLGYSNFDPADDAGNYQEISLSLELGWHYLTVVAAELVSDGNHTEWFWDYAKDTKKFYVAQDRNTVPMLQGGAYYNTLDVEATPVNSEDLPGQAYNIDSFLDAPRPVAETTLGANEVNVTIGTVATPIVTDLALDFNASDTELELTDGPLGAAFLNYTTMGPYTYMWIVNDKFYLNSTLVIDSLDPNDGIYDMVPIDEVYMPDTLGDLLIGENIIYFVLFGWAIDDRALNYGGHALPQLTVDIGLFRVYIGEYEEIPTTDPCPVVTCPPETTGPGLGIFISVSIVGLAAALIVRRRK